MLPRRATAALLLLSFFAFISLGLPDLILGVAWPSIRHTFDRPISSLGWLLFSGMLGYLSSSFMGGWITARLGVGKLLLMSSLAITLSLIGYAAAPVWPAMVAIGLLAGLGSGAIDAGINAYAAKHFSAKIVNWLHACWGIGATAGPTLMTLVLVNGYSWRIGYAILASLLALMTVGFALTVRLWNDTEIAAKPTSRRESAQTVTFRSTLARPIVWGQILFFIFYTGLESTVGQLMFSWLTESRGVSTRAAGFTVGAYWASLTIGRIIFGFISDKVAPAILLRGALMAAPICAAVVWLGGHVYITLAAVALLGLAIAPIYPLMISLTPARVGKAMAGHAIGFQVSAASLGAAAVPAFGGVLAGRISLEAVPPYLFAVAVVVWMIFELSSVGLRKNSALPAATS